MKRADVDRYRERDTRTHTHTREMQKSRGKKTKVIRGGAVANGCAFQREEGRGRETKRQKPRIYILYALRGSFIARGAGDFAFLFFPGFCVSVFGENEL